MDPLSLAKSAAKSLLSKLGTILAEEARLLAGVKNDVQYIMDELECMTCFLRALSEKQDHNLQVKMWLKQVRELAYDAEDTIEEFAVRLRRPDDGRGFMSSLTHYFRQLRMLEVRHRLATELEGLKLRAHDVSERRARYDLRNGTSGAPNNSSSGARLSSPSLEDVKPVAIEERRDTLVGWLLEDNQPQLRVISIVGLGGLGKTTLAMMVFESSAVTSSSFQARAWIAVSQSFEVKALLQTMTKQFSFTDDEIRDILKVDAAKKLERGKLERLMAEHLNKMEETELKTLTRKHLGEKRYVIVFDDIWSTNAWNHIKGELPPDSNNGSRVIVTTRIGDVAEACCSPDYEFIYRIPPLEHKQSWELFCKRVFNGPCPEGLIDLSEGILKKCGGLPIAIVTVAGVLSTKPNKTEEVWETFLRHMSFELETNPTLEGIKQALTLSYNNLPYHLKLCLQYLGVFPEDYEISKKRLVRRWIAEGLISARRDMSNEEVAETYFNELINRSLIQPSKFDDKGKVKTCRVHDIMLGLIVSLSMDENFITVLDDHTKSISAHGKIRRLSLQRSRGLIEHDPNLSQARSLTVFGTKLPLQDYAKARLLRVLDLQECKGLTYTHLKNISKLILLKFLSLRNTNVKALPYSIRNLHNLEFLDVRGCYELVLPSSIVKLQKLVYFLSSTARTLPRGIGKMKALRKFGRICVSKSDPRVIREIAELTELEHLEAFFDNEDICNVVNYCSHRPFTRRRKEFLYLLQKLHPNLRTLALSDMFNVFLNDLHSVTPAQQQLVLEEVYILGRLGTLPSWFASLHRVAKITLIATCIRQDAIQILKPLPALIHLRLHSFEQWEWRFDRDGFKCLKFLEIVCCQVSFEEGALLSTERLKLYIFDSPNSFAGIGHLHKLKEVYVNCENKTLLDELKNRPEITLVKDSGMFDGGEDDELEYDCGPLKYIKQLYFSHCC